MSSSTRVGFLIPAATDQADEGLYYNNNITTYEAELPSNLSSSLPSSGSYTGQIRTIALASPGSWAPKNRFETYVWNGTAWVNLGAFGFKNDMNTRTPLGDGGYISSSGSEVFQPAPCDDLTAFQVGPNQLVRFSCNVTTDAQMPGAPTFGSNFFVGKFNIFINPNSGTQPNPGTAGAVRLSFPIVCTDDGDTAFGSLPSNDTSQNYHYGELFYLPNVSSVTTMGAAAYLSTTNTGLGSNPNGTRIRGEGKTASIISTTALVIDVLGEM